MKKAAQSDILSFYQEAFNELYIVNTLINMVKTNCQEKEFKGEYYGLVKQSAKKLSDERNDYINILSLLSDKISNIQNIHLSIEKEYSLQQNSDYCRR